MKQLLTVLGLALVALSFNSCERCAVCTTVSDDPQTIGETLSTEVCGSGREYTDQIEIYERTNWTCSED